MQFSEFAYMYDFDSIFRMIKLAISATLFLMLVALNRYTIKKIILYAVVLMIVFLVEIHISNTDFLVYLLLIMCFPRGSFEKFISFDVFLKTTSVFIIMLLCSMGIINNYIHVTHFAEKQSLGFSHPNILSMFICTILVEWLYLRFNKMKLWDWVVILGIMLVNYNIAASRTSTFVFLLIYVLFLVANYFPRMYNSKLVKYLFVVSMPLMAMFSFVGAWLYVQGNQTFIMLNELFTGRWEGALMVFHKYGVTLLGQKLELFSSRMAALNGVSYFSVDNAYFYCVLQYGILYFILLCVTYIAVIHYAMNNHIWHLALFCLFFVIVGFGESYLLNPLYNVALLCLFRVKDMSFGGESKRKNRRVMILRRAFH